MLHSRFQQGYLFEHHEIYVISIIFFVLIYFKIKIKWYYYFKKIITPKKGHRVHVQWLWLAVFTWITTTTLWISHSSNTRSLWKSSCRKERLLFRLRIWKNLSCYINSTSSLCLPRKIAQRFLAIMFMVFRLKSSGCICLSRITTTLFYSRRILWKTLYYRKSRRRRRVSRNKINFSRCCISTMTESILEIRYIILKSIFHY